MNLHFLMCLMLSFLNQHSPRFYCERRYIYFRQGIVADLTNFPHPSVLPVWEIERFVRVQLPQTRVKPIHTELCAES